MPDVNVLVLTGVATKNATLRPKASGQIKAEFSFEVARPFYRANGEPVSDLFLIDVWGELAQWAHREVKQGTRLLIIGTLNKESYLTRHGGREHLTIVKAKALRTLAGDVFASSEVDLSLVREDFWPQQLIESQIDLARTLVTELTTTPLVAGVEE